VRSSNCYYSDLARDFTALPSLTMSLSISIYQLPVLTNRSPLKGVVETASKARGSAERVSGVQTARICEATKTKDMTDSVNMQLSCSAARLVHQTSLLVNRKFLPK